MAHISLFEEKIGVKFKNIELLRQAFTHRSFLNENKKAGLEHNERLEFLGDAVLELVITDFLYKKYKDTPEGELTSYRAALVNTVTLSKKAQELGFNDFLMLSRGEAKDVGRARQFILANTFEAVIGAIYLDQGLEKASEFILSTIAPLTDEIVRKKLWKDAKSRFQEIAQEKMSFTPNYETVRETGPDHDKLFTVGVYVNKTLIAEGEGNSKQEAEQQAAEKGLQVKGWE